MSSTVPASVVTSITNTRGALQSATLLINTFKAKTQAALDAILANGATEAELAPLATLIADLDTDTAALASAVAANP